MAKFLAVSILSVLLCLTFGCAYWYQPAKSYDQCAQDLQQCYEELQKYADMNSITCYEVDFVKDCMRQKGYELLTEKHLPKCVRRRDPTVDSFWVLAGVSGTVE
jgi:hypothetical protein